MKILYWTDHLQSADRPYVGEKAWQLSRLQQDHYPVCGGFVVSSRLFSSFLEHLDDSTSLLVDFPTSSLHVNVNDPQALQWVAQQSRQAINQTPMPKDWQESIAAAAAQLKTETLILRASLAPTLSTAEPWSGLLSAQICPKTAIEAGIKQIWSQLLGAKSLFYWRHRGVDIDQIQLAILVQPIFPTLAAGIAEIQPDYCEVQAIWGLGRSLQAGEVLPTRYYVDLDRETILHCENGSQARSYDLSLGKAGISPILRSQILTPPQQDILPPATMARLIPHLQRLATQHGIVEWSMGLSNEFYLHQWTPRQVLRPTSPSPISPKTALPPLLKGIGVAPGQAQAMVYVQQPDNDHLPSLPDACILVAEQILPQWLPQLKKLRGMVVEKGGVTSHAAILAREFGIPAIVSVDHATQCLKNGQYIQIDGQKGLLYEINRLTVGSSRSFRDDRRKLPLPTTPLKTQLMVNLSQIETLQEILKLPIDGIGLLRSELMMMELLSIRPLSDWLRPDSQAELVEKLAALIQTFAAAVAPRPLFYRTYDDKGLTQTDREKAPTDAALLPRRGTYGYRMDSRLFDLELKALKKVTSAGFTNLRLVLPFVRSIEEIEFCQQRLQRVGLKDHHPIPLWIMAEVPSVLFQLPQYVNAGIQGIAIGTNDFSQLLLGIDRDSIFLDFSQSHCPPALLTALKQLIALSHSLGIPCSICGQAPIQYPAIIPLLIDWGVTALSVEPSAVAEIYTAIANTERSLYTPSNHTL